jgi:predicted RNase H-like nuclease (RuvC/YqgF family)
MMSDDERMKRVDDAIARQLSAAMAENIRLKRELADGQEVNDRLTRALLSAQTHCDTLKGTVNTLAAKIDEQQEHIDLLKDAVQTLAKDQTLE